ncbi:MAG TPA: hypothetical protein EYN68_11225 [Candidatus Marinimicrobia bacterium]|nr:hypothetical protein [Candidatus Neomarinimicrobiota bacterium]
MLFPAVDSNGQHVWCGIDHSSDLSDSVKNIALFTIMLLNRTFQLRIKTDRVAHKKKEAPTESAEPRHRLGAAMER